VTRVQHRALAAWSVLATLLVLAAGGGAFEGEGIQLTAAAKKQIEVDAPGFGGDDSSDDFADDTSSSEGADGAVGGETVVSEEPLASEPTESDVDTPVDPGPAKEELTPSKIEHVFVITLAGRGFDAAFGPASAATYLNGELRPKGALLEGYSSLGQADLPDYIAMIGGQPPNDDTRAGCPTFKEIAATATPSKTGEIGESGCVYPNTVTTVADQLTASGRSWRAYVEDIERGPKGDILCRRPESNAADDTLKARVGDGYATRHNPFVYFHSLLDLSDCDANNGPLTKLEEDLASAKATPNYAFITPNLCNDGTESPCVDGSPGGLAAADAFLAKWVPKILASLAYQKDGLLIVTFAGAVAPEPGTDPEQPVRHGSLLVSKFAQAGSTVGAEYDPYSVLRSTQDLFGLRPLARSAKAKSFADTVLADALVSPPSDD
jgi:hypothetical protein